MDKPVFGRKAPQPTDRELHGQLLVLAVEMLEAVIGQAKTLPELRREYADSWPEAVDIEAIDEGIGIIGPQLGNYAKWMAANAGPMPRDAVEHLGGLFRTLEATRDLIANSLADILMDKLMKSAIRNTGSALG